MAVFEQKKRDVLDDTVPLTCIIENAMTVKDHTQYILKVQRGPLPQNTWTVSKRYSDFDALDALLKAAGLNLPLPPKKVFGKMDRDFIAERQQGLQNYLNALLNNTQLASLNFVKRFLDPHNYPTNLREMALQQISMYFRSEIHWEVVEPVPDIGWRVRKQYFTIRNRNQPKMNFFLSWSTLGPDKFLEDRDLEYVMKLLPTFQHPYLFPVAFASSSESSAIAIRQCYEAGSLRDSIRRVQKIQTPYLKKYIQPKQTQGCQVYEIKLYGRQILEALKYMHEKNFPYGHLHAGNVVIDYENSRVRLLDIENWVLGLPAFYRHFFTNFRKISSAEAVDVYSFGQLVYEMAFGEPLGSPSCDAFPASCPPELRSVLESILSSEACKNGLPSVSDLLSHSFFQEMVLPPVEKPQMKIPSKVKEALREARSKMEARLKEEQKQLYQHLRLSKAQAFHMSEEEKKKRRKKSKKQLSQADASSATPNGADTPPRAPSVSPTPNGHEVPPPPPPPPVMNGSLAPPQAPPIPPQAPPQPPLAPPTPAAAPPAGNPGRSALLSSIQSFSKTGLKKAVTVDKSGPKI